MRGRKAGVALVAGLLALGLVLGATAQSGRSAQVVNLKIAYGLAGDPAAVGEAVAFARLRREKGIATQVTNLASPGAAVAAVVRGDADIGITGLNTATQAINQGAPLKAFLLARQRNEWLFVGNTRTVSALRGKRVGYQAPGTETEAFARVVLRRAGVGPRDVEMTALPGSPNRASALIAGRLDGAWVEYVDYVRVLRRQRNLHVLSLARNLVKFSALNVYITTVDYLQDNRALLQRFVRGTLDGYDTLYKPGGRNAWLRIAKATVLEDDSSAFVRRVYDNYRRIRFWPERKKPVTRAQWLNRVSFWLSNGIADSVPTFTRVWDLSLWNRAARAK